MDGYFETRVPREERRELIQFVSKAGKTDVMIFNLPYMVETAYRL